MILKNSNNRTKKSTQWGPIHYDGLSWFVGGVGYSHEVGPFRSLAEAIECLKNYRKNLPESFKRILKGE